jgi:Ca2+-binding RTX toxin-like protein
MVLNANSFQDVTNSAGIVWSRQRGDEAFSISWLDYNKDGLLDLWISGHGYNNDAPNQLFGAKYPYLYINNGDGTFTNLFTQDWRRGNGGDKHGTTWFDFDNDGDRDVVISGGGRLGQVDPDDDDNSGTEALSNLFFVNRNSKIGLLTEEVTARGLEYDLARGRSFLAFDGNNDGLLDLIQLVAIREDGLSPTAYFEQQPNGTFLNRTTAVGLNVTSPSRYAQLADLTGDGKLDLIIQGTYQYPLKVYDISGSNFQDITNNFNFPLTASIPPDQTEDFLDHSSARDSIIADFDGDGDNDIFLVRSNISTTQPSIFQGGSQIVAADLIKPFGIQEIGYSFQTSGDISIDFFDLNGLAANLSPSQVFIGASGRNPTTAELEAFVNFISPISARARANDDPRTTAIDPVAAFVLSPNSSGVTGLKSDRSTRGVYIGYDPATQTWEIRLNSGNNENIRSAVESTQNITNLSPINFTNIDPASKALTDQFWRFDSSTGQFVDDSIVAGLTTPTLAQSAVAGDFDNDKDIDIYIVNAYGSFNQPNILYENQGNGTFVTVPQAGGAASTQVGPHWLDFEVGARVATADYDGDGFLDIFLGSTIARSPGATYLGEPPQLFKNQGNSNNWIQIDLQGIQSNRDGIGAQVRVTSGGTTQLREQNGGMHNFAQNSQRLHFGLGQDNIISQIEIRWSSGITQVLTNIPVNQILTITEPFPNNFNGTNSSNNLNGTSKADLINGLDGNDTVNGAAGNDSLIGGNGNDSLNGGNGNDTLLGEANIDTLNGGAGNDLLIGGDGNDTLNGNNDDDTLNGGAGSDRLDGGSGFDHLIGDAGNDTLIGGSGEDYLEGGINDDSLRGDAGNDTLIGGAGLDTLRGAIGNDLLNGDDDHDFLTGEDGNDTLNGGLGNDTLQGGNGNDLLNGGDGNDTLNGGEGGDTLNGGEGNDNLIGEGGNDSLVGGAGNDTLRGGNGNDILIGGNGSDRLIESGDFSFTITNTQVIGRGTDTYSEIEFANLTGGGSSNTLDASAVTQISVRLDGAGGADLVRGGAGNDTLIGGVGNDTLTGGAGIDRFTYLATNHRADTITDFIPGQDRVVISAAGFGGGLTVGILNANLFVLGNSATDANDRFLYDTNNGRLFYDVDGTGSANAFVLATLQGIPALSNTDIQVIA